MFINNWSESELEGLKRDFELSDDDLKNVQIVFATYTYEDYSGNAFVLFRNTETGIFYEVHGSHCSCHGLEDQWEPEEVNFKEMFYRVKYGQVEHAKEIMAEIKKLADNDEKILGQITMYLLN